jgi:hypothetical protein
MAVGLRGKRRMDIVYQPNLFLLNLLGTIVALSESAEPMHRRSGAMNERRVLLDQCGPTNGRNV